MEKIQLFTIFTPTCIPKKFKFFSTFISINKIPKIVNEEQLHPIIDGTVNDQDFERSETEKRTDDSSEKLQNPQKKHRFSHC